MRLRAFATSFRIAMSASKTACKLKFIIWHPPSPSTHDFFL